MRKTITCLGLSILSAFSIVHVTQAQRHENSVIPNRVTINPVTSSEFSSQAASANAEDPTTAPMPPSTVASLSTRTICWFMPDENHQPILNSKLRFTSKVTANSAGHDHHSASRPSMTFSVNGGAATSDTGSVATDATGRVCAKYIAPQVSGEVTITVNGTTPDGRSGTTITTIPVKVRGLTQLGSGNNYGLVGSTSTHVSNHWGTQGTNTALIRLANAYAAKFATPNTPAGRLNYNDMSLIWGGLFDINAAWVPPHSRHRLGTNVDFAILAVPPARRAAVKLLVTGQKFSIFDESDHWHLTYTGSAGASQGSASNDEDATGVNGKIEQTVTNAVNVQASVNVALDPVTGLVTYNYSFRNDQASTLEVSDITIPLNNSMVFDVRSPQGWTPNIGEDGTAITFTATEVGNIPANFQDEGQLLSSPFQIKPGATLGGFSFVSLDPPGQTDFFAEGFKQIPELGEDETALPSDFKGVTQGPRYAVNPSANIIDDPRFFVRQHYRDFFNREPDLSGFQFWGNQITNCGTDTACREFKRINTSGAFFLSIEFQQTGYEVYRFNKASFGSMPRYLSFLDDTQVIGQGVIVGAADWERKLEDNTKAFADTWVARAEFKSIHDNKTSAQFVDALFANAGVTPSSSEREALIAGLTGGVETRATVLRKVANNTDFKRVEFNRAFVLMQYFGYLGRNPDDEPDNNLNGLNFWLNKLNQFGGDFHRAEMVKAFIISQEYRERF